MALKAKFKLSDIRQVTDDFYNSALAGALEALERTALQVVIEAKLQETYADQSGNLRSSIGYVIFYNGEKVAGGGFGGGALFTNSKGVKGNGAQGTKIGPEISEEIAAKYAKGFVVVIVAGMEYAAYVEAKGYDVLTGSSFMFTPYLLENMKLLEDASGIKFETVRL